ncbi:Trk system potassium uptake protein [Kordiimonas sediminis]|uniref:Trk system potassium uptake protein n=1 Tax=Kordiimonas sediminis TaxID=1735581 RepID=A0A919E623_9PROT|nr:TrkH family potassium uptake protein [Kordiimonas sediminis]GHF17614.1 Trk system potassium uptake protein [Kordiimonas sediminis]
MTFSIDIRPIVFVIGLLLVGIATFMMIPAIVEAVMVDTTPTEFLFAAATTGFFGFLLILANRDDRAFSLDTKQAFLLTASCWIILPVFAALPLLGMGLNEEAGLSFTDAVFETVSGITTTGSTVMTGLDDMLPGILLWRSLLNWIGGVGIVVMAIILLPFLRIGGMQLFRAESSDKSEKVVPKSAELVKWITSVYLGLTFLCALAYYMTGMSGFDAINHAMSTLATGGYSTHDASFGHFGAGSQWIGSVFMLAGAFPFIAFIKFAQGRPRALIDDPQIQAFIKFLAVVIFFSALMLQADRGWDFFDALRIAAFNIISIVTTTGFASTDYTTWGTGAVAGFFILTFMGGCAGSTSGAIKIYRFQVLWITLREQLIRLNSPNRVVVMRYHGARMAPDLPISVLAFLAAFFASIAIFTLLLAMMDIDFVTALSASATAITNVGPGFGDIIGPSGNFSALPDGAKWLLCLAMLLGRLEVFTLLMLFDPQFWRE